MKHSFLFYFFICSFLNVQAQFCLDITNYGVIINGTNDNTDSLQAAINDAASKGTSLCFPAGIYRFSRTLTIPSGVSILGSGMGSNATSTPYNGTILWYTGNSKAISLEGTNASISNLSLYNPNGNATKGLEIYANAKLIESVTLNKVQFYGFTNGTALSLKAENAGGIAYASFYDIRVRHAKTGIEILEVDNSSFVNSNSFFHGVISGGGFDYAILVNGGNNNTFYSMVIEPPSSNIGHIYVNKGQIICENIRIEATQQAINVPTIYFSSLANQSKLSGFYAGGLIQNSGNNLLSLASPNSIGELNSNKNLLLNSGFYTYNSSNIPDYWTSSNVNAKFSLGGNVIVGQNTLVIKVPPSQTLEFFPKTEYAPKLSTHSEYNYANLSILAKTNRADKVKLTYNSPFGVVSSIAHSGNSTWETLGLQSLTNLGTNPNPKIYLNNISGTDSLMVELSSPSFCFGQTIPNRDQASLNTGGGIVTGLITTSVSRNYSFLSGTNFLVLPKNSNTFIINGSGTTISRINHLVSDRIASGTILTLLMETSGISVQNSAYINLKSAFNSSSSNTSLTLMSNGDGTWREVNRNN